MGKRADALADRVEQGARALADFARSLNDQEWGTKIPPDGRTVGVIIHHVASIYPLEIDLARTLADGKAIEGVTWAAVAEVNAKHAHDHAAATRAQALELLEQNSRAAADAVRRLSDEELDRAAPVSLNGGAPLTAQFFIEDHALRHSFHHLAKLKAALGR
jgi:hypothetical protein